jgi:uncharacterized repeat protein (TIGR01451 family)
MPLPGGNGRVRPTHALLPAFHYTSAILLFLAFSCTESLSAQTCVTPPSGIIAWWPFDETSGTIANDIAGDNLGADVNSPAHVPGEVAYALGFNGTNYVGVVDSPLWAFGTAPFTIEFWANFASSPGGSMGEPADIFIGNDEGSGDQNKWFFAIGGGNLEFHINSPTLGPQFFPLVPFSPTVGQWYHLAITRSGSTYTIYIDGVPSGSATNTNAIPTANAPLTIAEAEDIGYMDGDLDEMTIYNLALTHAQILSIYNAGHGGKCKQLTITTPSLSAVQLGTFFSQQLQAAYGQPPYTWSVITGSLPSGVTLSTAGVLSGTSTDAGQFVFTVEVTDSANSVATQQFTLTDLVTLPPPTIRVTKSGTLAVPGRTSNYFILVENIGTTTATNFFVVEFLQMQNFTLLSVNPPAIADVATLADAFVIPWNIASLSPGESTILTYQVQINPTVPIGQTVTGTACAATDLGKVLRDVGKCLVTGVLEIGSACAVCAKPLNCGSVIEACAAAEIPIDWPICIGALADCGACIFGNKKCLDAVNDTSSECIQDLEDLLDDCGSATQPTLGAIDPNQKTVTAGQYIQINQELLYPIQFTNVGTAPAYNVYVTDVLDANLDPSTLQILTPGGVYNSSTRTITWSLLGEDLQPGATANVLFSIYPLANLASGTTIQNTATIQFDVFSPMTTNQVANVIDTTPPTSTIGPLPWRVFAGSGAPGSFDSPTFTITWQGTDPIGSIASYTIFESSNGGPFSPYLENTTETQTTFTGHAGNTYGFISIATDTAGNIEVEQPVAEATILVSLPGDVNGDGLVNCTDVDIVKAVFGTKVGQPAYNREADVNNDGVVNVFDLAFVTQNLPVGTKCQ